jgi:hypothetical protein
VLTEQINYVLSKSADYAATFFNSDGSMKVKAAKGLAQMSAAASDLGIQAEFASIVSTSARSGSLA